MWKSPFRKTSFPGGVMFHGWWKRRWCSEREILRQSKTAFPQKKCKELPKEQASLAQMAEAAQSLLGFCFTTLPLFPINNPLLSQQTLGQPWSPSLFCCQWRDIRLCLHYWWLINTTELVKSTTTRTFTKYARPCQTEGRRWLLTGKSKVHNYL